MADCLVDVSVAELAASTAAYLVDLSVSRMAVWMVEVMDKMMAAW